MIFSLPDTLSLCISLIKFWNSAQNLALYSINAHFLFLYAAPYSELSFNTHTPNLVYSSPQWIFYNVFFCVYSILFTENQLRHLALLQVLVSMYFFFSVEHTLWLIISQQQKMSFALIPVEITAGCLLFVKNE